MHAHRKEQRIRLLPNINECMVDLTIGCQRFEVNLATCCHTPLSPRFERCCYSNYPTMHFPPHLQWSCDEAYVLP